MLPCRLYAYPKMIKIIPAVANNDRSDNIPLINTIIPSEDHSIASTSHLFIFSMLDQLLLGAFADCDFLVDFRFCRRGYDGGYVLDLEVCLAGWAGDGVFLLHLIFLFFISSLALNVMYVMKHVA